MTDDSITIPYNGCGTNVDQSDGRISFTNQITGDDRAVMIDNIIVGEKLSLGVSCQFDDTFTLTAGEFAVGPADFLLGSQGNIGYVSVFFNYFHDVPSTFLPVKFFRSRLFGSTSFTAIFCSYFFSKFHKLIKRNFVIKQTFWCKK